MAIGTKLGRLALRNWVRVQDIKPALVANDIPALDFTVLPLPRNYRAGLVTTRANAQDITIAAGQARDLDDGENILVTSAITKQIDADWAEGSAAGGFPDTAITISSDTIYHVFILGKDGAAGYDAGFDEDISATNLLGDAQVQSDGYTVARRVASLKTHISASPSEILDYTQNGRTFTMAAPEITTTNDLAENTSTLKVLNGCPIDHSVVVDINLHAQDQNSGFDGYISSPDSSDQDPADRSTPLGNFRETAPVDAFYNFKIRTNTSAQVRVSQTGVTNMDELDIAVLGWDDDLGEFD
jgi:hypothetical protein